jgi:hypothetical protein
MARCRFVQPEAVRVPLSEGDWVEFKKRLSVGEEREAFQAVVGEVNPEGWRRPNMKMMGIAEVVAYVVDWSFKDAQDKPIPASADAIKQLSPDDFKEIEQALERHIASVEAEDAARKNDQGGKSKSEVISPSAA